MFVRYASSLILGVTVLGSCAAAQSEAPKPDKDGWYSLFNGKNLDGWKANEAEGTFKVVDGLLVVKGDRSHLFYVGPVNDADFVDFEWKCEIMTKTNSNSGMYFHTKYQEEGWPAKGYEVQVNNTHGDIKKTGGLYARDDVLSYSPVKDNEWFTQHVVVRGKRIQIYINGKLTTDYTEPDDVEKPADGMGRFLDHGTFALQGHDPDSEVHYRKVLVKPLKSRRR